MTQNENEDDFLRFVETMSVFLNFPHVEKEIRKDIDSLVNEIIAQEIPSDNTDDVDHLSSYLSVRTEMKLKIILGFSGGSIEKLRRVVLHLFPDKSWKYIINDCSLRRTVCSFLLYPERYPDVPQFIQDSFRLSRNWHDLIRDRDIVLPAATESLVSKYSVAAGQALEEAIGEVVEEAGLTYVKGGVEMVDFKEVDLAIPNIKSPAIMIMSSYSLTTSSAQSSRANEQARMYEDVQRYNRRRRNGPKALLINVIDGGGWKVRRSDLKKMYMNCDDCYSYATLKKLGQYLMRLKHLT